jgi:hypothetical protein
VRLLIITLNNITSELKEQLQTNTLRIIVSVQAELF